MTRGEAEVSTSHKRLALVLVHRAVIVKVSVKGSD